MGILLIKHDRKRHYCYGSFAHQLNLFIRDNGEYSAIWLNPPFEVSRLNLKILTSLIAQKFYFEIAEGEKLFNATLKNLKPLIGREGVSMIFAKGPEIRCSNFFTEIKKFLMRKFLKVKDFFLIERFTITSLAAREFKAYPSQAVKKVAWSFFFLGAIFSAIIF